ncbi:hypothetical protein CCP3SC1_680001 [Gammaproteobacteria bacterium]
MGTSGAFVAGTGALTENPNQEARPFNYTTATPPSLAETNPAPLRGMGEEPQRPPPPRPPPTPGLGGGSTGSTPSRWGGGGGGGDK